MGALPAVVGATGAVAPAPRLFVAAPGPVDVPLPGVALPGVVAGAEVVVLGVVTLAVGAVTAGAAGVVTAGVVAAGPAIVVVTGAGAELESPASLTSAAASTPSASTATTEMTAIGAFQLGVAASRVRAAAPQRRHQSCSGLSGVPHSGQASVPGARWGATGCASPLAVGGPGEAPPGVWPVGAAATATSRRPAGG